MGQSVQCIFESALSDTRRPIGLPFRRPLCRKVRSSADSSAVFCATTRALGLIQKSWISKARFKCSSNSWYPINVININEDQDWRPIWDAASQNELFEEGKPLSYSFIQAKCQKHELIWLEYYFCFIIKWLNVDRIILSLTQTLTLHSLIFSLKFLKL